ncbi:hypothetical protein DW761_07050 [Absiella sp. AM29-15]|nr:hypothetical protein DW761_07050 [Absiella sp. AM29-15]
MIFDSALYSGSVYAGSKVFDYVKGFRTTGEITIFHFKTASKLSKKAPSLEIKKYGGIIW